MHLIQQSLHAPGTRRTSDGAESATSGVEESHVEKDSLWDLCDCLYGRRVSPYHEARGYRRLKDIYCNRELADKETLSVGVSCNFSVVRQTKLRKQALT
jgi:hypothetical protein